MLIVDIIKCTCLLLFCICTSITDIKYGLIKNKFICVFLLLSVILDGYCLLFNKTDYLSFAINISIAVVLSIVLYLLNIWAAGDSKMMIIISLLIPYTNQYYLINNWTHTITILALIFILAFIYLIFDSIYNRIKGSYKPQNSLKSQTKLSLFNWISCVSSVLFVDLILWLFVKVIFEKTALILLCNICIILLVNNFSILKNKYWVCINILFSIIGCLIFRYPLINKIMLVNYILIAFMIVLRTFISQYNYEIIPTQNVKEGMILSTATTMLFINSRVKGLPGISRENLSNRITKQEVQSIKIWQKSAKGQDTIEIVRKIPFAVFISAGTICFIMIGVLTG